MSSSLIYQSIWPKHKPTCPNVFIPGWAMDHRIFPNADDNSVYIQFYNPFTFIEDFLNDLNKHEIQSCQVLGFSMGGFVSVDFLNHHPDRIKTLELAGVRKAYDKNDIEVLKTSLQKNKDITLQGFYKACCMSSTRLKQFKPLFEDYKKNLSLESLLMGLEYLSEIELAPLETEKIKRLYHGQNDVIAPLDEVKKLSAQLEIPLEIYADTGHLCLNKVIVIR